MFVRDVCCVSVVTCDSLFHKKIVAVADVADVADVAAAKNENADDRGAFDAFRPLPMN